VHADLREQGWKVSVKTVADSMRRQGLIACVTEYVPTRPSRTRASERRGRDADRRATIGPLRPAPTSIIGITHGRRPERSPGSCQSGVAIPKLTMRVRFPPLVLERIERLLANMYAEKPSSQ
jgi:hypothetical protein